MSAVRARYDGKVFVPQDPVDLAEGEAVTLTIKRDHRRKKKQKKSALDLIVERGVDDNLPADLGYQHDHYLVRPAEEAGSQKCLSSTFP